MDNLKSDHRMQRNYLKKDFWRPDLILLAATGFNLKKWMNIYFYAFTGNLSLLKFSTIYTKRTDYVLIATKKLP